MNIFWFLRQKIGNLTLSWFLWNDFTVFASLYNQTTNRLMEELIDIVPKINIYCSPGLGDNRDTIIGLLLKVAFHLCESLSNKTAS